MGDERKDDEWYRTLREWNSDVLNVPLTRTDPGPMPNHVRILSNEELLEQYGPDDAPEPPDAWDTGTDTQRPYEVTIGFDADTDIEALLVYSAIYLHAKNLGLRDLVLTATHDKEPQ